MEPFSELISVSIRGNTSSLLPFDVDGNSSSDEDIE